MDLSALTLQQLRYIVAVDRNRSFREAARACHVSQPGLSAQIKKVEEILGLAIFDRTRQPVVSTEVGARVVVHAQIVLDQVDQLAGLARGQRELVGSYRLGMIPSLVPSLVPLFLPRFADAHPRVELEVVEAKTEELVRRLREGALDAGIAAVPLEVPTFTERLLFHETFFVYLPPRHGLAARDRIRQADLYDEHVWLLREGHCFRSQALHLCSADARSRPQARVSFDADSFETLVRLVDEGVGLTILPDLVARALSPSRRSAQLRPFAPPAPARAVGMVLGREVLRKAASEAVFATLREALPKDLRTRRLPAAAVLRPRLTT